LQPRDRRPPPRSAPAALEALVAVARKGPVGRATARDLRALDARSAKAEALAATALKLAAELDDLTIRSADLAACSRALRETLDRLRELAPPVRASDAIDDVAERRADRRAARPAAS
jgi:hypothetical protein